MRVDLARNQMAGQEQVCTQYGLQGDVLVLLNSIEKCLLALTRTDLIPGPEISPQTSLISV